MKTFLAVGLLAVVLFFSGCTQAPPAGNGQRGNTVEITATGFSPQSLVVKAGDTVTFVNKDSALHWPASALHPTHNEYPEPGGCIGSKFDSCKGLEQGESFSFKFDVKGTWRYHNHLNPTMFGSITVE